MAVETKSRIDVLDGLRGLAIALVVVFHVWQLSWLNFKELTWLPRIGFVGVEIFFVLSGFCIAYPFVLGKKLDLKEFYGRRALKILPSYVLVILCAAIFFDNGTVSSKPWLHLGSHLTFTQNWSFETYYSTLGPAWSLAVEVQFYLLFPLLLPLFRRQPVLTALGLALISILARRWAWDVSAGDEGTYTMRLNQLPGCLDLFACGMLSAWATVKVPQKLGERRWLPAVASVVAVGALVGLFWLFRNHEWIAYDRCGTPLWQSRWRLTIGALVGLVAASGSMSYRGIQVALANPLLRFLGAISYNLYLWHKLITDELFRRRWPAPKTPDPHNDPTWQLSYTLIVIGLSVLVATALTYGLEQPTLRWGKRRAVPRAIE